MDDGEAQGGEGEIDVNIDNEEGEQEEEWIDIVTEDGIPIDPFADEEIEYGQQCVLPDDGYCGPDCSACHWSWPASDPLGCDSENAGCRCMPETVVPEPSYDEGWTVIPDCDGMCGDTCSDCRWGWPSDDIEACGSSAAMCICADNIDDDHVFPTTT